MDRREIEDHFRELTEVAIEGLRAIAAGKAVFDDDTGEQVSLEDKIRDIKVDIQNQPKTLEQALLEKPDDPLVLVSHNAEKKFLITILEEAENLKMEHATGVKPEGRT